MLPQRHDWGADGRAADVHELCRTMFLYHTYA
jgi:hypothetical protein